jgi:hypothetical protein
VGPPEKPFETGMTLALRQGIADWPADFLNTEPQ